MVDKAEGVLEVQGECAQASLLLPELLAPQRDDLPPAQDKDGRISDCGCGDREGECNVG